MLAEAIGETDDPEVRRRLADRMTMEAGRMASVVDDILQLAASESLEEPHEPVIVADVLRVAAERLGVGVSTLYRRLKALSIRVVE